MKNSGGLGRAASDKNAIISVFMAISGRCYDGLGHQPRHAMRASNGPTPSSSTSRRSNCSPNLRANGLKTFIVSGGGIEFMRPAQAAIGRVPSWGEKIFAAIPRIPAPSPSHGGDVPDPVDARTAEGKRAAGPSEIEGIIEP
jgi:hypothetical protein